METIKLVVLHSLPQIQGQYQLLPSESSPHWRGFAIRACRIIKNNLPWRGFVIRAGANSLYIPG